MFALLNSLINWMLTEFVDLSSFHSQDIILMSTNCHDCGYRDTEVKSGGAIAEKGRRITLKVEESDDLSRDILKVRHPFPPSDGSSDVF